MVSVVLNASHVCPYTDHFYLHCLLDVLLVIRSRQILFCILLHNNAGMYTIPMYYFALFLLHFVEINKDFVKTYEIIYLFYLKFSRHYHFRY